MKNLAPTAVSAACAAVALTALTLTTVAHAQTVTFANIADSVTTNGGVFGLFDAPSLNAGGTVAFRAFVPRSDFGIFANTAGSATAATVADSLTLTRLGGFSGFGDLSINDSGVVAFNAGLNGGGSGIFTNTAGSPEAAIIADSNYPSVLFRTLGNPSINAGGIVAFRAGGERGGLFTNTAGNLIPATVADTNSTNGGAFSGFGGIASINAAGTVAFRGNLDAGGQGIFTNTAGSFTATLIANTGATNGNAFSSFGNPLDQRFGSRGVLCQSDGGNQGVFTNLGGSLTPTLIADSTNTNSGAFSFFGGASINAEGTVAFLADLDAGGSGIFAALSGSSAPFSVVQVGDSLFDSTVDSFGFSPNGLNDGNALAFSYRLANGREGHRARSISRGRRAGGGEHSRCGFGCSRARVSCATRVEVVRAAPSAPPAFFVR
jgi:hypothetical protein